MPVLTPQFYSQLAAAGEPYPRFKWYITAAVALSAMNYPEELGPLYTHLLEKYIPAEDHASETRKIKEALVKAAGLHGAAKTGNAMRELYRVTPGDLLDRTCYRENDIPPQEAYTRGDAFLKSLYRDVPDLNTEDDFVRKCSPDYFYLVSRLLYPHIFSFDQILDKLESSQAIISSLIGSDCANQAKNHMKGMLWNGATREEVTAIRDTVVRIAQELGVKFKNGIIPVPELPKD
ncbi:hypothetical protein BDV18DRAFT_159685 [Aspergillus unguis]